MALKPDRIENPYDHDINFYMDEAAERGGIVVLQSAGSGGYPGDPNSVCTYAATAAGRFPLGILLCDVVAIDQSRQHMNWYREQVPIGYKVILDRKGLFTTNMIYPGINPVGGESMYLAASGLLSTAVVGVPLGQFRGAKDEDGFVSVFVDIP
jgi:hypothetical protein